MAIETLATPATETPDAGSTEQVNAPDPSTVDVDASTESNGISEDDINRMIDDGLSIDEIRSKSIRPQKDEETAGTSETTDAQADTPADDGATAPDPSILEYAKDRLNKIPATSKRLEGLDDEAVWKLAHDTGLKALQRARVPRKMIESMTEAEIVSQGLDFAEQRARQDQTFEENRRLKEQLEGKSDKQEGNDNPDSQDAADPSKDDGYMPLAEAFKPLVEEDDLSESIIPQLTKIDEFNRSQMQLMREQVQQTIESSNKAIEQYAGFAESLLYELDTLNLDSARNRMKGDLPGLDDDAKWDVVSKRAYEMSSQRGLRDESGRIKWDKVVKAAYRVEYGDDEANLIRERATKQFNKQRDGQPLDDGQRSGQSSKLAAMSHGERETWVSEQLDKGVPREEIRRKLRATSGA